MQSTFNPAKNADSKDIRDKLIELIERAPAGGIFNDVQVESNMRNSLCLRLDPDGPIFTVEIRYGGVLRSRS